MCAPLEPVSDGIYCIYVYNAFKKIDKELCPWLQYNKMGAPVKFNLHAAILSIFKLPPAFWQRNNNRPFFILFKNNCIYNSKPNH